MSRNIAPFGVRMPPELKDKVEKAAKDAGRSMNAEIVHRLQQSFADPSTDITNSLVDQILAHKGSKLLESDSLDTEELSKLIYWISDIQNTLVQRLINLKGIPQGNE